MKVVGDIIIGFIFAVMVLFTKDYDGGNSLKAWMDAYEKFLYAQMEENFRREQEAEEKARAEEAESYVEVGKTLGADTGSTGQVEAEVLPQPETVAAVQEQNTDQSGGQETLVREVIPETTPETAQPETIPSETVAAETAHVAEYPLYMVDGYLPDENIQTYLYARLCEAGIGHFHPYAICLIAQESTWNPLAENINGLDKGLLQYRITYWPTLEWWNPYAEIDVFVQQMANRANIGCTVSDMISRHKMSDYGGYDQVYVDQVMSHSGSLVRIR